MPALLRLPRSSDPCADRTPRQGNVSLSGLRSSPLVGTTIAEPVPERITRLTAQGLIPQSPRTVLARRGLAHDIETPREALSPGTPDARTAPTAAPDCRPSGFRVIPKLKPSPIRDQAPDGIPFVIRIDDGVCKEPALCWLLALLASRGQRASLEVVPYLMDFDESFLDRFDPSGSLFEVSQHGYAHVPRATESGRRCEFYPESEAPTAEELNLLARGKQLIERAFPPPFPRRIFAAVRCASVLVARSVASDGRYLCHLPLPSVRTAGNATGGSGRLRRVELG